MKREIIILGMGPGFEHCPCDKETWTLNMGLYQAKRVDKLFMTDPIERRSAVQRGFYIKAGKKIKCSTESVKKDIDAKNIEFISSYAYPDIKNYKAYPIREIMDIIQVPYFVNTITYMIAYAIYSGVSSIDIWGINQATQSEYVFHKACVEFWVGLALGMGIKVHIHGSKSSLVTNLGDVLYGYRVPYETLKQRLDKSGELIFKHKNKNEQ